MAKADDRRWKPGSLYGAPEPLKGRRRFKRIHHPSAKDEQKRPETCPGCGREVLAMCEGLCGICGVIREYENRARAGTLRAQDRMERPRRRFMQRRFT